MNYYPDILSALKNETAFMIEEEDIKFFQLFFRDPQAFADYEISDLRNEDVLYGRKAFELFCTSIAQSYGNGDKTFERLIGKLLQGNIGTNLLVPILRNKSGDTKLIEGLLDKVNLTYLNNFLSYQYNKDNNFNFNSVDQNVINLIGEKLLLDSVSNEKTKSYMESILHQNHPETPISSDNMEFADITQEYRVLRLINDFSLLEKILSPNNAILNNNNLLLEDILFTPKLNNLLNNANLPPNLRETLYKLEIDPYSIDIKDPYLVDITHKSFSEVLFDNPLAFTNKEKDNMAAKYIVWIKNHSMTEAQEIDLAYKIKHSKQSISKATSHALTVANCLARETSNPKVISILKTVKYLKDSLSKNPNYPIDDYNLALSKSIDALKEYFSSTGQTQKAYYKFSENLRFVENAFHKQFNEDYTIPQEHIQKMQDLDFRSLDITAIKNNAYSLEYSFNKIKHYAENDKIITQNELLELIALYSAREIGLNETNANICCDNFRLINPDDPFRLGKVKTLEVKDEDKESRYNDFIKAFEKNLKEFRMTNYSSLIEMLINTNANSVKEEKEFKALMGEVNRGFIYDLSLYNDIALNKCLEEIYEQCISLFYNKEEDCSTPYESQLSAVEYIIKYNELYKGIYNELKKREIELVKKVNAQSENLGEH